jgi:hypothetical protein
MTSRQTRVLAFLPLAAVMLMGLSGCPFSPKSTDITPPPPPSKYVEQSSAANVLANLQTAYEFKEFLEYDKLFSGDYIFVFNPADAGDPNDPTPQQWQRADEMDATRNMFGNDRVETITLSWSVGELETHDTYGWKVRVDEVNLNVNTRNLENELWIYQVKGDTHVFYFREEDVTLPSGKNKWTCTRWEDSPIGFLKHQFAQGRIG